MYKDISHYDAVREKILDGVTKIADPVKSTLTPKGTNVIYEDGGGIFFTNDGVTIAKQITLEDRVSNTVADIIKQAALKTNSVAGDGTTTSVLLSEVFIKEGLKLIESGMNPMRFASELDTATKLIIEEIKKLKKSVKNKTQLRYVALVSSSNDEEIADNVVKAVEAAGEDGQIFLDQSKSEETEIVIEEGYNIESGMFNEVFRSVKDKMISQYNDVKVLVTDKRLYYDSEAVAIMECVQKAGYNTVVVIAQDFIGRALNTFIANHAKGNINVLLIKEPHTTEKNSSWLEDVASYIGTEVVTDKKGKLTFDVDIKDFATVPFVFSNHKQTILRSPNNKLRKSRTLQLKMQLAEDKENEEIKKRLALITGGNVALRVFGTTHIELREKLFKYEDSVNATRAAQKHGYVAGGGTTLYKAFKKANLSDISESVKSLMEKVCTAPLRQIAKNCDIHYGTLLSEVEKGRGYNAVTERYETMEKAGVIEPTIVSTLSFESASSVAKTLLTSRYFILNHEQKDKDSRAE